MQDHWKIYELSTMNNTSSVISDSPGWYITNVFRKIILPPRQGYYFHVYSAEIRHVDNRMAFLAGLENGLIVC